MQIYLRCSVSVRLCCRGSGCQLRTFQDQDYNGCPLDHRTLLRDLVPHWRVVGTLVAGEIRKPASVEGAS